MMKKTIQALVLLLLFVTSSSYAAQPLKAFVSYEGDTFNFELSGQKNWDYDVRRVKEGGRTKVQLLIKSADKATVEKVKSINNPFVDAIRVVDNAIDNKTMVEFTLKSDSVETFDYLTDQPSKLIVDFYASEEPSEIGGGAGDKKNKGGSGKKIQQVKLDVNEEHSAKRTPADVDYLKINPENGIETSFLAKSGLFDAGDAQFKRFNMNDSDYKDESIIRSRSNYYLRFPFLETEFSFWKKMKDNPPLYEIKPESNDENKQARLLKTLFSKKRYLVFLQTLEWFTGKYPKSKYVEMFAYMKGDALVKVSEDLKELKAYEQAQTAYREALEQYPDSVLAERTSLMTGLLANDRADYMQAIRRFNLHIQNKKFANKTSVSYAKLALAYAYSKMQRRDEALSLLNELEKETKDQLVLTEIAVRRGDFNFMNKKFSEAITEYDKAAKNFPMVSKLFPSAYFNKMEALFWRSSFKESHGAALEFAQNFPSHEYAPYALTRVGELLDIMGADQTKSTGAYLETHFRYGNSAKTIVAKLHLLSARMKSMKDEELAETLKNMDEIAKKSELENIDQFKVAMMADGYSRRREFAKAIEILSAFYQSNPNRPDVRQVKERIAKNIGDQLKFLADKQDYKAVLKTYRQYADTWLKTHKRLDTDYFLGLSYEKAGAFTAALEKYKNVSEDVEKIKGSPLEKEIRVNQYIPDSDTLSLRMAKSFFEDQKPQEAYQLLQKIQKPLELSEVDQVERVDLAARLYQAKGDQATSIRYLTELSNLWKGDQKLSLPVQFKLAELQTERQDLEGAGRTYERCRQTLLNSKESSEADLARLINTYGKVLVEQNRADEAIAMIGELFDKFDHYPLSQERYYYGDLLFKRGEIKKAELAWEKIKENENTIWKKLAEEKLKQASWDANYRKHIRRIPAMAKQEEAK